MNEKKESEWCETCLGMHNFELNIVIKKAEVLVEALKNCEKLDRSIEPDYGEFVRGNKLEPGQRFKTPREMAREVLTQWEKK